MEFIFDYNQKQEIRKGDILLAEPFMTDPNFERAVVLVCEHNEEEGSFGLVLNKPSVVQMEDISLNLAKEHELFIGGPVEQDTLHYLHTMSDVKGAVKLRNGVYWGGEFEHLQFMAENGFLTTDNCRFFMGYSGWSHLQLRDELENNSWIVSHQDPSIIFKEESDTLWQSVLKNMGGKYKVLSNYPRDPRWN
ncbi:YqgE/AlgH family protein [Sediminitomix flava]|uniref:Putative transcriptional regulator n=1 Tax=Sediminitomix flava TaxID=379075 RepID=A0A315Z7A6_SEDFL|nr:YqgE/AlgH family protein [Sediminitomix flava]PWJ40223.1 putative transcriptional regulator [Sediminitomix flava]